MKTNTNSRYAVAVLIDGDNTSFEKMEDIMSFVSRYGDAVVRRIYGDWTKKALSAWKETAREHGFRLVQASSHAPGKNTTDIALVIDAMDILRDGRADCFCLVASDGDYISQVAPVALMLIAMPISGSIGHGIGLGLITYTVLKVFTGKAKEVSILTYAISLLFLVKFFLVV